MKAIGKLSACDLSMLRQTLVQTCTDLGIDADGPDAQEYAYQLLALYRLGITTETELKRELRLDSRNRLNSA